MNGLARDMSRTSARLLIAGAAAACLLGATPAAAATPCQSGSVADPDPAARTAAAREIAAEAERIAGQPGPYPSFCAIPPVPRDVRPPADWAMAIADTREAGAVTAAEAANAFSPLEEPTEPFAEELRQQATPPPQIGNPQSTDAFVRDSRGRATPPPVPH
jgi:hypothetical protein